MLSNLSIYNQLADQLSAQFSSITFEAAHSSWQAFWPTVACNILDIGAGNGRDAKWFESLGCDVIAVEPAISLNEIGQKNTGDAVRWLNDQLPKLPKVQALERRFDVILLSAVWMHIPPSDREQCFRNFSNLLTSNGILIITLRHGEFTDGRTAFPLSVDELQILSKQYGLSNILCTEQRIDQLGRSGVFWQTLVFRLENRI